jgi:hypothetical protein
MIKIMLGFLSFLLIQPGLSAAVNLKLLTIKPPVSAEDGKNQLLVSLENAADIVEPMVSEISAKARVDIEFNTVDNRTIAQLGRIKNQKIKWTNRITSNNYLTVPCSPSDYVIINQLIEEMVPRPGYQVVLVDPETRQVLRNVEVTFLALPDLTLLMQYPVNVPPDVSFGDKIILHLRNNGSVTAGMFSVQILICSGTEIPRNLVDYQENFSGISRLKNGLIKIESLRPGESREIPLTRQVTLPPGLTPGKYYLAAVIDPGDQVRETDESNNIHQGFIMITFPVPDQVTVLLPDTRLIYSPESFDVQVISNQLIISRKNEWRKCNIRPHLFQIRHASWKDFHWEIDTRARQVWRVTGAEFCKRGGDARQLRMNMRVTGGNDTTLPQRVDLLLTNTRMEYQPGDKRFRIRSFGDMLIHLPFWSAAVLSNHLYHIGCTLWPGFFLEINARDKTVSRAAGDFTKPATDPEFLELEVRINSD